MLRPLRDRIVVRPMAREKTATRLIVLDNENDQVGEVVAVGPGARTKRGVRPLDVKVGDVVRFGCDYLNFPEYRENGTVYRVLQEADIVGIVEQRVSASNTINVTFLNTAPHINAA